MSILVDQSNKVVIYGITGKYGLNQTKEMLNYGTAIVAGITPGRGGQEVLGIPVYDTMEEVLKNHEPNTAIIYVPTMAVKDVAVEAIESGMKMVMIAAEGVPLHDMMLIKKRADEKGTWVVGPNTLGLVSPGKCSIGSLASSYAKPGPLGFLARGGTISIEMIRMLSAAGFGQSTCVGAGGDKVLGKNPADYLRLFENDPETKAVILVGEIGGQKENECAKIISQMTKPVYFYLLGRTAPPGARMGHIGTIIAGASEGFEAKRETAKKAGAILVDSPWHLLTLLKESGLNGSE